MPTSNIQPTYPSGTFQWTDKIDNVNIDYANDINSAVAEIEAIETTLGANPQIEPGIPGGVPVTYNNVSQRISDAMYNNNLPYSSIIATNVSVIGNSAGFLCPFRADLDDFRVYNGVDMTITNNGWWDITSSVTWPWNDRGYVHHMLVLNGTNVLDEQILDLEFSGNVIPLQYSPNGTPITPGTLTPRFYQFGKRQLKTHSQFSGPLHEGDRISIYLENGCDSRAISVPHASLKAQMVRIFNSNVTFTSG